MDFFYGVVALLAFVVLILTALTAWMYVQQTRTMQAVNALTAAITAPPPSFFEAAKEFPVESEYDAAESVHEPAAAEPEKAVDDRVSVHEEDDSESESEEHENHDDTHEDDLGGKTVAQLREMLTAKGIPFNKSDKKPVLLNLLKVAS